MKLIFKNLSLIVLLFGLTSAVYAERVKDLSSVAGMRDNQLIGYGLVVGLDGSGDSVGSGFLHCAKFKKYVDTTRCRYSTWC